MANNPSTTNPTSVNRGGAVSVEEAQEMLTLLTGLSPQQKETALDELRRLSAKGGA